MLNGDSNESPFFLLNDKKEIGKTEYIKTVECERVKQEEHFKPYISPEESPSELTVTAMITGILLAVVFGAANAYLGLRVGMTVSASIPAAVISMGVIRLLLRKNSVLECNIVQTIGSAGESVAAGAIFTLPALFIWAAEGIMDKPKLAEITIIALLGGLLGVFLMIPLRRALIVREHRTLPYPEGKACSEVLLAGEKGGSTASTVFLGAGVAAVFKFIIDGLKLVSGEITLNGTTKTYPTAIGTQIYPAVMSVGFICGPRISSYMLAGGVIGWAVLIPLIVIFGGNITLYPATETVATLFENGGASAIWSTFVRYIGAGALAAGGIISLIRSLPLIFRTFRDTVSNMSSTHNGATLRTERDINTPAVLAFILLLTLLVWLVPSVPVSFVGAVIVVVFGFFFATVSSRMVGLVGSSNNPVSGMAIATLLIATLILKATKTVGVGGMQAAMAIGSIICIVAALAGDTSQDLKTGFLLGATPKKQQIGEIIGVIAAALAIGATLYLLDSAWGFGSEELGAPQAMLMKLLVEGVMGGNLPWGLIIVGAVLAVAIEVLRIPVLPFAIGLYLPVQLSACIAVGGFLRKIVNRIPHEEKREKAVNNGILFCSGMIAGEGVIGILLAVLAVVGFADRLDISGVLVNNEWMALLGSLLVFTLIILCFLRFGVFRNKRLKNGNTAQ